MTSYPHLSLYDLFSESEEEVEYLITGILPKTGLVVLLGAYGTGKTQLAMRMASCVAIGSYLSEEKECIEDERFNFCASTVQGYTLYLAGEGKARIQARIKAAMLSFAEQNIVREQENIYNGVFPVFPVKVNIPLKEGYHIDEINGILNQIKQCLPMLPARPSLIIFDTLSACHFIKDENSNSEMQRIANSLQACAEYFNCCVIVITHPPKSNDGPKGYSRGASALVNSADIVIEVKKVNNSPYRNISIVKMKDGEYEGASFRFKVENFGSAPAFVPAMPATEFIDKQVPAANVLNERQQAIIKKLEEYPEGVVRQEKFIKDLLKAQSDIANIQTAKRMARRDIKNMHAMGLIVIEGVRRETILKLPAPMYVSPPKDMTLDEDENKDEVEEVAESETEESLNDEEEVE